MSKHSFKLILKYLLQLMLLTIPAVTIFNIIIMIATENNFPLLPFASMVSMKISYINLFLNGFGRTSSFGPLLGYIAFFVGEIPCVLICLLYIAAFLGVKTKKTKATTYLQYYVIVEGVLLLTYNLYAYVYIVLFLLLLFYKDYVASDKTD